MKVYSFVLLLVIAGLKTPGSYGQSITASPSPMVKPQQGNLAVDDYFRIKEVSDPQISPEGKWVAYVVKTAKLEEDKNEERVWMAPSDGGEAIALTAKNVSSNHPRWSPDGKYLAILSERDEGQKQVWLLNRLGGEAQQLTDTIQDVKEFDWSPAGDRLVLVLQDPSPDELEAAKNKEKGKKKESGRRSRSRGPS
jgi:dipeptidyl aminopeptidase/acylaminoacyl peptidase